jgi:hypothetical protein
VEADLEGEAAQRGLVESSNRLVVQMKMPAKRSMPCSISLTSVTS